MWEQKQEDLVAARPLTIPLMGTTNSRLFVLTKGQTVVSQHYIHRETQSLRGPQNGKTNLDEKLW